MDNNLQNSIIWTKHALKRLEERRMPKNIGELALLEPDEKRKGKEKGIFEFIKNYKKENKIYTIILIVTKSKDDKWLVISVWVDPIFDGSLDASRQREKISLAKRRKPVEKRGRIDY